MKPTSQAREQIRSRKLRGFAAVSLAAMALALVSGASAVAAGLGSSAFPVGDVAVPGTGGAAALKGDLSLDEAIDRAQKRYRARVVRAEQVEQGGRVVYVLRLLSDEDGRVFTVRVDARSGEMQ